MMNTKKSAQRIIFKSPGISSTNPILEKPPFTDISFSVHYIPGLKLSRSSWATLGRAICSGALSSLKLLQVSGLA
jgi:hypothetical protein